MCSANWRCSCTNTIQPISSVYELIQPINSVYEFDTRLALSNEKRVYGTDICIHSWVCGNNPQFYKRPFSGPYASILLILERPISVPQATGHAGQSQVNLFRTITGGDVGTSEKSTNGPFQDPTQKPYLRMAHFSASSHKPVQRITSQFISTNHRGCCGNAPQVYKRPFSGPYPITVQI